MLRTILAGILFCTFSLAQQPAPEHSYPPGSPLDLVQKGQKLSREGKQDDALALYRQAIEKAPDLYDAYLGAGMALDLKGDYTEAHKELQKAIDHAGPDTMAQALRSMALSHAFEGNAGQAAKYEKQVFDDRIAHTEWLAAATICNELARIYLELGDPSNAYKWYKKGYETILRTKDMSDADKNLWLFRWENAQARIAARRGNAQEAQQHVAAAKAALDKANNPDQLLFYPYLTGYVAFYTGDYKTAIADLQKADQHDPFILVLLGQAFEKSGDAAQARNYYSKVLQINIHNPTNAFARPLARKKLGEGA